MARSRLTRLKNQFGGASFEYPVMVLMLVVFISVGAGTLSNSIQATLNYGGGSITTAPQDSADSNGEDQNGGGIVNGGPTGIPISPTPRGGK